MVVPGYLALHVEPAAVLSGARLPTCDVGGAVPISEALIKFE